jgi:hypothetical protein
VEEGGGNRKIVVFYHGILHVFIFFVEKYYEKNRSLEAFLFAIALVKKTLDCLDTEMSIPMIIDNIYICVYEEYSRYTQWAQLAGNSPIPTWYRSRLIFKYATFIPNTYNKGIFAKNNARFSV